MPCDKNKKLLARQIILASHNPGKLKELSALVLPFGIEVLSAPAQGLAEPEEPEETFEGNAFIKAFSAARAIGLPALGDDSGLCIEALGGKPGVRTAAWACRKEDGTRDFNLGIRKTERALRKAGAILPETRRAKFVSVLCLAFPDGAVDFFHGEVEGTIVWPPRGHCGFGYDPVFCPQGYDLTFAEMTEGQKRGEGQEPPLSHRARAFRKFSCLYLKD